jgi:Arc/MetJ family transcription regulator
MRTNIDIDDVLLTKAMHAGPFTTKKETVEAGLRLLARQAAYREILKWEGKLKWEGDESIDWTQPALDEGEKYPEIVPQKPLIVQEPGAVHQAPLTTGRSAKVPGKSVSKKKAAARAGR